MTRTDTAGHLAWFKSSYSDTNEPSDCIEVAITEAAVHIRDSKNPQGPRLALTPAAWTRFVAAADEPDTPA